MPTYNETLQGYNQRINNLADQIKNLPVEKIPQEKIATPTEETQEIVPDDGSKTLNKVTVEPIPGNYITTSDANATEGDIFTGKTAYVNGSKVTGTMADGDALTALYGRENPILTFDPSSITLELLNKTPKIININTNSGGKISVISNNPDIISAELQEKTISITPMTNFGKTSVNVSLTKNNNFRRKVSAIEVEVLPPPPQVLLSATPGKQYIEGLSDITPALLSQISELISNNNEIINTTEIIYIDYPGLNLYRKINCGAKGDSINIVLNDQEYTFNIIGFNCDTMTDNLSYGKPSKTNKAGITLQLKGLSPLQGKMNSIETTTGGWRDSSMRTQTLPQIYNYFSTEWKQIIKKVNKTTYIEETSPRLDITSDTLFLLSEGEIFGSEAGDSGTGYANDDEILATSQYPWYKKNSILDLGQWERSPNNASSYYFCYANGAEPDYKSADLNGGISFSFCI